MTLERMEAAALQSAIQQAGESWVAGPTALSELADAEKPAPPRRRRGHPRR